MNAAGVRLVRYVGGLNLQRHRKAEAGGDLDGLRGSRGQLLPRHRDADPREDSLAVVFGQHPGALRRVEIHGRRRAPWPLLPAAERRVVDQLAHRLHPPGHIFEDGNRGLAGKRPAVPGKAVGGQRQHEHGLWGGPGARGHLIQQLLLAGRGGPLDAQGHADQVDAVIAQQRVEDRREVVPLLDAGHSHRVDGIAERTVRHAQNLPELRVDGRGQGRALESRDGIDIADERRGAAGDREENDPLSRRQASVEEQTRGLHQLVQAVHQRHACLPEQSGVGLLPSGQGARVSHGSPSSGLGAAELQNHHGLLPGGRRQHPAQLGAVLGPFHDAGDDLGLGVVGQVFDVVGHLHHGLVAAGDDVVEADVSAGAQLGDGVGQPAALGDERDAARDGVLRDGEIGVGEAVSEARHPHAAGAGDGHASGGRHPLKLGLTPPAGRGIPVRETLRHHDARGRPRGNGFLHYLQHLRGGQRHHHAIRHLRKLLDGRITRPAPDLRVVGIHRIDGSLETRRKDIPQYPSTRAGPGRRADNRHRTRLKQCLKICVPAHSLWESVT